VVVGDRIATCNLSPIYPCPRRYVRQYTPLPNGVQNCHQTHYSWHNVPVNPQSRKWPPNVESEPLTFPRLLDLELRGASTDLKMLLVNMSFPRIERASITLEREPVGSSSSDFRLFPPRFTSLVYLTITLYDTWEALSVLEYFIKAPIRFLDITIEYKAGELGDDYNAQLKRCFSCFEPETLKVHAYNWSVTHFLLQALKITDIRDLSLTRSPFLLNSASKADLRDSIALPRVENVTFSDMLMSDVSSAILAFSPLSLQTLSVELPRQHRPPHSWSDNLPIVPVSVTHLCFSQVPLTGSSIREYFRLATNVEYLALDFGSNWSISHSENDFHAAYPSEMSGLSHCASVNDSLKHEEGFLPFPNLRQMRSSFPMEAEQEDDVLHLLSEVFNTREKAGGSMLVLTKVERRKVKYVSYSVTPPEYPNAAGYTLFRFTFQMP
jgi:hypothetical protein